MEVSSLVLLAVWWWGAGAAGAAAGTGRAGVQFENDPVVNLFREYLRLDTSPSSGGSVNYTGAVEFWKRQAASLELPVSVYEYYSGKPIVVITWQGADPAMPSIMLNSHMDVVAADESVWKYPPYDAYMDEEGDIYARGAQDTKGISIQYLEAIRRLRADNITLARTLHITLVPDEETGGFEGMRAFVETADFAALNIGFALDEGMPSPDSSYIVSHADRTPWQIVVTCIGPSGHGSNMPVDTAAGKFRKVINSFLDYRESQLDIALADPSREAGSITSINLTKVSGGLATNIIPASMSATFDMRLAFDTNATEFNQTVTKWIKEAGGEDCSHDYIRYEDVSPATPLDDSNIYWVAFKRATDAILSTKMIVSLLVLLLAVAWCDGTLVNKTTLESYETNPVVNLFREYIRINTSYPIEGGVNYTGAVEFWKRQAASLELPVSVYEYYSGKPIVVITWQGSDPALPSIMLNSHMDVVAADESKWKYPPFDAYMDQEGNIYGRGAQDMKVIAIQYLEAIRKLRADNVTLARTIHMTLVPDEEIGGFEGMREFVDTEDFAALNVGFVLDESYVSPTSSYFLSYADKSPWQIVVTCTGPSGHGSQMPENTAAGKFRKIIDSFLSYRESQLAIIRADPSRKSAITSINLTKVSGGLATNIIPASMSATFDMRLAFDTNVAEFNKTVTKWIKDAGGDDCSHYYLRYEDLSPPTPLDDSNIYWVAFMRAMDTMCLDVTPISLEGTTDIIRLRSHGIPAFGFHPIIQTEVKLHDLDEYLGADQLLRGVDIYVNVLKEIGNASASPDHYLPSSCGVSSSAASSRNIDVVPQILTATSDMIRLRSRGIPALGFGPVRNTQLRAHDADEYVNAEQLLRGAEILRNVLQQVGNA